MRSDPCADWRTASTGQVKSRSLTRIVDDRPVTDGQGHVVSGQGTLVLAGFGGVTVATRVQEPATRALDQSGCHPARQKELTIAREACSGLAV